MHSAYLYYRQLGIKFTVSNNLIKVKGLINSKQRINNFKQNSENYVDENRINSKEDMK